MFLLGVFVSCTPVRNVDSGLTSETQKDTSTEQTNSGEQYPDSTLPEDIRISFQIATTEEAQYIHTVHGNHFDASGNRFFDAEFYMIYRFPIVQTFT